MSELTYEYLQKLTTDELLHEITELHSECMGSSFTLFQREKLEDLAISMFRATEIYVYKLEEVDEEQT